MKSSFKVKLAIYAGEILLRNGAEAFRVEDTIIRILKHYNFKSVETITTTTGIFVSIVDVDGDATTLIKRIHNRTIDLHKIARVNSVSRQICEDKIELLEAYKELKSIAKSTTYEDPTLIFAWVLCCFGFAYVLDNSISETLVSASVGLISGFFAIKFCKNLSRVAYPCVVSAFTTAITILFSCIIQNFNIDNVIISCIMPLLPGVSFVNSIRDTLNGDYMCATSRMLDVLLVAVCIALGVGFSFVLFYR